MKRGQRSDCLVRHVPHLGHPVPRGRRARRRGPPAPDRVRARHRHHRPHHPRHRGRGPPAHRRGAPPRGGDGGQGDPRPGARRGGRLGLRHAPGHRLRAHGARARRRRAHGGAARRAQEPRRGGGVLSRSRRRHRAADRAAGRAGHHAGQHAGTLHRPGVRRDRADPGGQAGGAPDAAQDHAPARALRRPGGDLRRPRRRLLLRGALPRRRRGHDRLPLPGGPPRHPRALRGRPARRGARPLLPLAALDPLRDASRAPRPAPRWASARRSCAAAAGSPPRWCDRPRPRSTRPRRPSSTSCSPPSCPERRAPRPGQRRPPLLPGDRRARRAAARAHHGLGR